MAETIIIREAVPEDLESLRNLGIQTSTETFGPHNTTENLHTYLESKFNAEQLKKELLNPESAFYIAAVTGEVESANSERFSANSKSNSAYGKADTANNKTVATKSTRNSANTPKEKLAGYLKLNFGQSQTEIRDDDGIEIERIYAIREYHGKKIGQSLYETALRIAVERKSNYIWLGVWEKNERAISFYRRNGFVEFDKHVFRLGDDVQTDIMMKKFCGQQ